MSLTCQSGSDLYNDTCVPTCPASQGRDLYTGACSDCGPMLEPFNGVCVRSCDDILHEARNPDTGLCECKAGFERSEYSGCVPGCTLGTDSNGWCNCEYGFERIRKAGTCLARCSADQQRNLTTEICECLHGKDSTDHCTPVTPEPSIPLPTPPSCTSSKWSGIIPVRGGPGSSQGVVYYYLVPLSAQGCTGMYTLSYQVLPADQQVALYLVNGQETSLGFAPVITFASDPNGDAQIYLDFNITGSRPPSSYALNSWHRGYARGDSRQDSFPDTSVHWMLAYGTGAEARVNVQSPAFWDKKVGTFQMPYVIGAAGGGFLFAAVVGGFAWRRKMLRRATRRVSSAAERGGAKMTDTGSNCHATSRIPESQPSPREHAAIPNTDNIDQQVASTDPQQQQVGEEQDATSLREQDVEPRAPGMDEMSLGAVRCVMSGAERGGAEMTNTGFNRHAADRIPESQPSLREHAAIHSKPNIDDVDQQVAFTDLQQQRYGKDRDATPLREQDIEPRAPGMDEIEVLGKAE